MSNPERWQRFPPLPDNIEQALCQLRPYFEATGVQLAYLFGSLAQNGRGQDVDLALLTAGEPIYKLRPALVNHLQTERLDLVDLRKAPPVLRFEIVSTGRLIYAVNPEVENEFELSTLHLYRDTAPMRRRQDQILQERMMAWSSNVKL